MCPRQKAADPGWLPGAGLAACDGRSPLGTCPASLRPPQSPCSLNNEEDAACLLRGSPLLPSPVTSPSQDFILAQLVCEPLPDPEPQGPIMGPHCLQT